ncbi:MAG: cell division protein FtsA [Fibrobacter sp.]|jgi:cell division protein FtsA|uniref:cell division protein FtsA n=1 Tax=Fibrobacter sp. UWB5 TaxID=1964360 RepID=UPI000B524F4B|nr:cell division protein FtsA [Fibrobacter sp. UWB5]MBR4679728.1 cell division protein FtsA [Fibrobacter sp.]OWV14585.1 cell division protein FtsA [Fibrobacter sp. UWB5]
MDDNKQDKRKDEYIFGLDIGESKINLFVGVSEGENVRVVECGDFPLKNADEFDSVVETLQQAVQVIENTTRVDVHDVYVGIAGKHVRSLDTQGIVTLPMGEVREEDIENVTKQASTLPTQAGEIIHIFPGEYNLDDEPHIRNPKGRSGRRLGVDVQVVTVKQNALQNLAKCVNRAGLNVAGFVLEPLAAASAVLTNDERELGVALVDIGAGTADIAVFVNESVRFTFSYEYAGNSITSDISRCLNVPIALSKAEEIKKKFGTCVISNLIEDDTFPVPAVGNRGDVSCSRKLLAEIITARVGEIFCKLNEQLKVHQLDTIINGGIVLTGGCCALEGIEDVACKVFGKPVRIGRPKGMSGIQEAYQNPSYATGIGLLYYANKQHREKKNRETGTQIAVSMKKGFQRVLEIIRTYL